MPGKQRYFYLYERNFLVYQNPESILKITRRLVLGLFTRQGLYLLGTYNLRNNYGNVWNDPWNNPYGNGNGNSSDPFDDYQNDYGYGDTYGNVIEQKRIFFFLTNAEKTEF